MLYWLFHFFYIFTESYLKKRWNKIRNDYKKVKIYNDTHSNKIQHHKLSHQLDFLIVDLNGAHDMKFDDLEQTESEAFCITDQMLDSFDTFSSITIESILSPNQKLQENKASREQAKSRKIDRSNSQRRTRNEKQVQKRVGTMNGKRKSINEIQDIENSLETSNSNERCEDEIFGELVAVMLKKMNEEEKKRVKKEIMNILL